MWKKDCEEWILEKDILEVGLIVECQRESFIKNSSSQVIFTTIFESGNFVLIILSIHLALSLGHGFTNLHVLYQYISQVEYT